MKIKSLFILMLAFLIYGCSDINSASDFTNNESGFVCVRGSLSEEMRTAVPGNIPDSGIAYAVKALAVSGGQSVEKVFTEKSFTLTLLPGTYKFSARVIGITDIAGFNNSVPYNEYLFGEILEEIEIQQGKQVTLNKIILRPIQKSGNTGSVKLKISTQVPSITSMKCNYIKDNTPADPVIGVFTDNESYFEIEEITSGTYFVDFSFMDSAGNLIYKVVHEAVNVYDHLETNKWIKSSNSLHLKTGEFIITPACVASFKHGPDYYVSSTGNNNDNTGTFFDPLASVQEAVDKIIAANDGVTSYNIILNDDITGTVVKTDENYGNSFVQILPDKKLNLTIRSADDSVKNILSSSNNARVLCAAGDAQKITLNLEKVRIAGGFTPTSLSEGAPENSLCGGGIFAGKNCDLTLTDCVIGETSTLSGVQSSIPSFDSVKNVAGSGSAIYLSDSDSSTVTLKNTKIGNCKAGNEGTVYAGGKSFTMDSSSVITGNLVQNLGSAIVADNNCIVTVSGTISNNYSTTNYPAICVRGNAAVTLVNAEIKDNGIEEKFESRCGLHVSEETLGTVKVNGNVTLEGILFSGWPSKKLDFYSRLTNTECFAVFKATTDDSSTYYIPDGLEIYVNKTTSSIADLFTVKQHSEYTDPNSWVITETSKVGKLECSNTNGGQLPDPYVYELTGKLTDDSENDITSISKNGGDVYFNVYKDGANISADIGDFVIEGYSDGVKLESSQINFLPVQTDCKVSISTVNSFTLEPGTTFSIYITFSYNGVSGYSSNFNLSVTE